MLFSLDAVGQLTFVLLSYLIGCSFIHLVGSVYSSHIPGWWTLKSISFLMVLVFHIEWMLNSLEAAPQMDNFHMALYTVYTAIPQTHWYVREMPSWKKNTTWELTQHDLDTCASTWMLAQQPVFLLFSDHHMVVPGCAIVREVVQTVSNLVCTKQY